MRYKNFKRVVSVIVASLFFINNFSYSLAPAPGSENPSTQDEMSAMGKKLFAAYRGPGIPGVVPSSSWEYSMDEYKQAMQDLKANFVDTDPNDRPKGWSHNPILEQNDLISAFKMFQRYEAQIPEDKLTIEEGYFPIDEGRGELPIARIEPMGDRTYKLIIHTRFVQMWNHIRQHDVLCEMDLGDGQMRTVSVAWGLFYRIAKHEMSDLAKTSLKPKSMGHITNSMFSNENNRINILRDETLTNLIQGRYNVVNDAIWLWFLGAYAFKNSTRYDDDMFLNRVNWILTSREAADMGLNLEFPNLMLDAEARLTAESFALFINNRFFRYSSASVPEEYYVDPKLIDAYHDREQVRREKDVAEDGADATGKSGDIFRIDKKYTGMLLEKAMEEAKKDVASYKKALADVSKTQGANSKKYFEGKLSEAKLQVTVYSEALKALDGVSEESIPSSRKAWYAYFRAHSKTYAETPAVKRDISDFLNDLDTLKYQLSYAKKTLEALEFIKENGDESAKEQARTYITIINTTRFQKLEEWLHAMRVFIDREWWKGLGVNPGQKRAVKVKLSDILMAKKGDLLEIGLDADHPWFYIDRNGNIKISIVKRATRDKATIADLDVFWSTADPVKELALILRNNPDQEVLLVEYDGSSPRGDYDNTGSLIALPSGKAYWVVPALGSKISGLQHVPMHNFREARSIPSGAEKIVRDYLKTTSASRIDKGTVRRLLSESLDIVKKHADTVTATLKKRPASADQRMVPDYEDEIANYRKKEAIYNEAITALDAMEEADLPTTARGWLTFFEDHSATYAEKPVSRNNVQIFMTKMGALVHSKTGADMRSTGGRNFGANRGPGSETEDDDVYEHGKIVSVKVSHDLAGVDTGVNGINIRITGIYRNDDVSGVWVNQIIDGQERFTKMYGSMILGKVYPVADLCCIKINAISREKREVEVEILPAASPYVAKLLTEYTIYEHEYKQRQGPYQQVLPYEFGVDIYQLTMVGQYESRYISTDVLLHSLSEEAAAAMITLLDDAGINRFYLDPDITRAQLTAFLLKGDNTRIFTRKKNLALDFKSYSFIEMAVRHISQTYTHLENNPEGWTGMFWAGHDRGEFLMELVQGVVDGLTAPNADVRRVSAELLSVCKINCGTGQEKVQLLSILNEGRGRVIVELPNDQTKALSVNALNRQIAQLGVPVTDNMNATGGRTFGADMGPGSNESATDEADRELLSHLTVSETEDQIGVLAAEAILKDIKDSVSANGRAVILFASAPSQHSTWKHLLALWSELPETERQYLADRIVAFHMDEYLGLDENAPQLFGKVLRENLFSKLGLKDENIFYFDDRAGYATALELRKAVSDADNEKVAVLTARLESEVKENLEKLEAKFKDLGGVFDIVIGGIGKLPHLAFNDPPEAKFNDDKILKIVTLTETSRQQQVDDKEFASLQDVPTHALTFSLTPIISGKRIHIMVPRAFKAEAVRQTLDMPIDEMRPASGLRLPEVLPNVSIYLDNESAGLSRIALMAKDGLNTQNRFTESQELIIEHLLDFFTSRDLEYLADTYEDPGTMDHSRQHVMENPEQYSGSLYAARMELSFQLQESMVSMGVVTGYHRSGQLQGWPDIEQIGGVKILKEAAARKEIIEKRIAEYRGTIMASLGQIDNNKSAREKELGTGDNSLLSVLSNVVPVGADAGPGSVELARDEVTNIWLAVDLLKQSRIEILIPQNMQLTEALKVALKDIKKREGHDVVTVEPYSDERHLEVLLEQKVPADVKRIVLSEESGSEALRNLATEKPEVFRNNRLLNISLPENYEAMSSNDKTFYQARMVMTAILARLYEKDKTPMVEMILTSILASCVKVDETGISGFLSRLVESANESDNLNLVRDRILYCLDRILSFSAQFQRDAERTRLMIKELWTAA